MESDRRSLRSDVLGKKNRNKRNSFIIPSFICDVAILGCLAAFAYFLRFTTTFAPFTRFFLCGDSDLLYPYYGGGDKLDEVEWPIAAYDILFIQDIIFYSLVVGLPPFIVLIGELMYMCLTPPSHKVITSCCDACCVPLVIRRLCRNAGVYLVGLCVLSILTDVIKMLSGVQRPYFLHVPGVNASNINATFAPYCSINVSLSDDIRDASQSFPSYHSTIACYAAIFGVCYVHKMFTLHGSHFFRPILSAAFVSLALLSGFSQWMLYRNSWKDLFVGYMMGMVAALYTSFGLLHGMREHEEEMGPLSFEDMDEEERRRAIEEARPAIFRWMSIPRLTMRLKPPTTHPPITQADVFQGTSRNHEDLARSISRNPGPSYNDDTLY